MTTISQLSLDDEDDLLEFETKNREWFARFVPDRGDAFFAEFRERLEQRLRDQEAGIDCYFVVRDEAGALIGRVNFIDIDEDRAELGYRIAEDASGQGRASVAVRLGLEEMARRGVREVRAMTTASNAASQRVLVRCGFEECPGEPSEVEGHGGRSEAAVHFRRSPGASMRSMIQGALVNMFTEDIEKSLAFYARLGFEESFRTPKVGPPTHVEARAGGFTLAFSTPAAARDQVGIEVEVGGRNLVVVFWVDDVDSVYEAYVARGAPALVRPADHGSNRSGWIADPNGNQIELVQKLS